MAQDFRIKHRIKTINTIGKISRAMQLVATAKLKKVSKRVQELKNYSQEIYNVFHHIISNTNRNDSIYLQNHTYPRHQKPTLWIAVTSNLGFCSGYNNNIYKLLGSKIKKHDQLLIIGGKGQRFYEQTPYKVINKYVNLSFEFEYEQVQEIGIEVLAMFNNAEISAIKLVYTKFINSITFEPTILTLLPIEKNDDQVSQFIEFEPNAVTVLTKTILLYLNTIIYSALIESQVSEQASRRLAMENATNNAEELKDELQLQYNRSRQAKITQEISEIIAAADSTN